MIFLHFAGVATILTPIYWIAKRKLIDSKIKKIFLVFLGLLATIEMFSRILYYVYNTNWEGLAIVQTFLFVTFLGYIFSGIYRYPARKLLKFSGIFYSIVVALLLLARIDSAEKSLISIFIGNIGISLIIIVSLVIMNIKGVLLKKSWHFYVGAASVLFLVVQFLINLIFNQSSNDVDLMKVVFPIYHLLIIAYQIVYAISVKFDSEIYFLREYYA